MSDYNGPSRQTRVRFTRDWIGPFWEVKEGAVADATHYPELNEYHVSIAGGRFIRGALLLSGLIIEEPRHD